MDPKPERCKHGMLIGTCSLCQDPDGQHERHYGRGFPVFRFLRHSDAVVCWDDDYNPERE